MKKQPGQVYECIVMAQRAIEDYGWIFTKDLMAYLGAVYELKNGDVPSSRENLRLANEKILAIFDQCIHGFNSERALVARGKGSLTSLLKYRRSYNVAMVAWSCMFLDMSLIAEKMDKSFLGVQELVELSEVCDKHHDGIWKQNCKSLRSHVLEKYGEMQPPEWMADSRTLYHEEKPTRIQPITRRDSSGTISEQIHAVLTAAKKPMRTMHVIDALGIDDKSRAASVRTALVRLAERTESGVVQVKHGWYSMKSFAPTQQKPFDASGWDEPVLRYKKPE